MARKGNDPRYTPTTTFETFPFPAGLTPNVPASSYAAEPRASPLPRPPGGSSSCGTGGSTRRNGSSGWTSRSPDIRRRPVPRDEDAAKALRKRTLTNLYNARPQWLADAHAALDAAVAAAYGWPADITDDDALRELLALNSDR